MVVNGLYKNSFNVSNVEIMGGVILFPMMMFQWDVASAEDIRPHHFDILEVIKPKPSTLELTKVM